jgi:hypothetical protein
MTVYSNGTWSNGQGNKGQWVSSSQIFMFHFNGSNTTYSGTGGFLGSISGIQATFNVPNLKGCFYMTRPAVTLEPKEEHIKGQPDAGGKQ